MSRGLLWGLPPIPAKPLTRHHEIVVDHLRGSSNDPTGTTLESVVASRRLSSAPDIPPADDLARVELFGLPFVDAGSVEVIADHLLRTAGNVGGSLAPLVVTPNVDFLVNLGRPGGDEVRSSIRRARWILPDGQPIVIASRLLRRPLSARLAGSSLFAVLWPRLADAGDPVLVVASSEEVARRLRAEHPGATIVVAPRLPADESEAFTSFARSSLSAVGADTPRFVISCIGHPRDLRLLSAILALWDGEEGTVPIAIGCGGAAEMHVGLRRRAPEWVQRMGMEWFFRFCQEPRRLFRRYFLDGLRFVPLVLSEARRLRRDER
jgi:N-acetylglucosaminyldiphosphoundecaprenol N-acetyl-beta-D-mannosaminyltransferase